MKYLSMAEQLLFSTTLISGINDNDEQVNFGTAFFLQYPIGSKKLIFAVTNRHIVENTHGAKKVFSTFTKSSQLQGGDPLIGETVSLDIAMNKEEWEFHSDNAIDVAVSLAWDLSKIDGSGTPLFMRSVGIDRIPSTQQLEELDAIEEIVFVGYPNGEVDKTDRLPLFRKGITASPLYKNIDKKPIFLIDANIVPGSSGSPVFLYNNGQYADKKGNLFAARSRLFLLGILGGSYPRDIIEKPVDSYKIALFNANIGKVFKTETIIDTIKSYLTRHNVETDSI